MKSFLIAVIIGILFLVALCFGASNEQIVQINYFIAQGEFRLPLVLAWVFLSGFLISWIFAGFYIIKLKLSLRACRKKLIPTTQGLVSTTKKSDG